MIQTQPQLYSQPTDTLLFKRWDKLAGRLILMTPALWVVFLAARGTPLFLLVGMIVVGSLATTAARCVVNDLWERNIDPYVERTRDRPLALRTYQSSWAYLIQLKVRNFNVSKFKISTSKSTNFNQRVLWNSS